MADSSSILFAGPVADTATEQMTLEDLYRQYRGPVQQFLYRLSGSADLAEELAQETFIRACAGLLTFRGECSVASWLFRIARNVFLNHQRRRTATRLPTDELNALPDHGDYGDPVRRYVAGEQRNMIAIALAELPEKQRTILLLRDAEGLAYAEIADVLGISLSAVKVNLFRARHAFRLTYQSLESSQGEQR